MPLRPWKPPRRERGETHCVCVPHSPVQAVECVCAARGAGVGRRGEPGARHCVLAGGGSSHAQRRMGVCACDGRGWWVRVPWSKKAMRVAAQVCGAEGRYCRCGWGAPRRAQDACANKTTTGFHHWPSCSPSPSTRARGFGGGRKRVASCAAAPPNSFSAVLGPGCGHQRPRKCRVRRQRRQRRRTGQDPVDVTLCI